jgi:eukaryotic-like serine/threonine-protein kinase
MAELTADSIAQRALTLGVLDERQMEEIWASLGSRNVRPNDFLQLCVRREFLTNYQVERLLASERDGFFFGDYKVQYYLGSGDTARVYRATHRRTEHVVAVKVLRKRYSRRENQYNRFLRNGELGRGLEHPNIVPVYEVCSLKTTHFVVMEFIEGYNLLEFVRIRKRIDPVEATKFMTEIASGLAHAAEQKHQHRDLKLTNVLISSLGHAKVSDFSLFSSSEHGVGYGATEEDQEGLVTVDYGTLERITDAPRDDPSSDIYFLGCMYYYMLTGVAPLSGTADQAKGKTRFQDVVPILQVDAGLPVAVTSVVERAMSLDLEERYSSLALALGEIKLVGKHLSGETEDVDHPGITDQAGVAKAQLRHTILVVEPDVQTQNVFRTGLKKAGYRVLLAGNAEQAVDRLIEDTKIAAGVLFNAQHIGKDTVRAFNRLGLDNEGQKMPAVLLLNEDQSPWSEDVNTAANRVIMVMPLKMRDLRDTLAKLVSTAKG